MRNSPTQVTRRYGQLVSRAVKGARSVPFGLSSLLSRFTVRQCGKSIILLFSSERVSYRRREGLLHTRFTVRLSFPASLPPNVSSGLSVFLEKLCETVPEVSRHTFSSSFSHMWKSLPEMPRLRIREVRESQECWCFSALSPESPVSTPLVSSGLSYFLFGTGHS